MIYEHKIPFHLFRSPVISSALSFLEYTVYTSFVKFIPKHFILFDAIKNGIAFIVNFDSLIATVQNTCDFCISILYPASLQNGLLSIDSVPIKKTTKYCDDFVLFINLARLELYF